MTEIKMFNLTLEQIKKNAEDFNYPYDITECADDSGNCLTVYQSVYRQIHYYFDKNDICIDVEAEEI